MHLVLIPLAWVCLHRPLVVLAHWARTLLPLALRLVFLVWVARTLLPLVLLFVSTV